MTHEEVIRTYFRCFKDKDLATLQGLLAANFRHASPYAIYQDRDKMLEDIRPHIGKVYAIDIEIFGAGPGYMVRYRHSGGSEARLAEFFRFDGDKIAEIEVYMGRGTMGG